MADAPHILILEARFYEDIADELARGAIAALTGAGASHEHIAVPGTLELPAALAMAVASGGHYDGYVVLGCVIRGETSHYDIVANESAAAIMRLVTEQRLGVGYGIVAAENDDQAWERAGIDRRNKGASAAEAALAMVAVRKRLKR